MAELEPLGFEVEPEVVADTPKKPVKQKRGYRPVERRMICELEKRLRRDDGTDAGLTPEKMIRVLGKLIEDHNSGKHRLPAPVLAGYISQHNALQGWNVRPIGTRGAGNAAAREAKAESTPANCFPISDEIRECIRVEKERREQPLTEFEKKLDVARNSANPVGAIHALWEQRFAELGIPPAPRPSGDEARRAGIIS